jgi:hypothetical protein
VTPGSWNPHWEAFARSLGRDPGELVGEFNAEFLCWIQARVAEFRRETGAGERLSDVELAGFGVWLSRWAEVHGPGGQLVLFEGEAA